MQFPWKKEAIVMLLCFLYGGFAIIASSFVIAGDLWQQSSLPHTQDLNRHFDLNRTFMIETGNSNDTNRQAILVERVGRLNEFPLRPTSAFMLVIFASGLISIAAGTAILSLMREKEVRTVKRDMANNLLMPDERKIIEVLSKFDYEMTQARIAKECGLSKVQVHRAVKRLESRGVLQKHRYGLTNKVILDKEFRYGEGKP